MRCFDQTESERSRPSTKRGHLKVILFKEKYFWMWYMYCQPTPTCRLAKLSLTHRNENRLQTIALLSLYQQLSTYNITLRQLFKCLSFLSDCYICYRHTDILYTIFFINLFFINGYDNKYKNIFYLLIFKVYGLNEFFKTSESRSS